MLRLSTDRRAGSPALPSTPRNTNRSMIAANAPEDAQKRGRFSTVSRDTSWLPRRMSRHRVPLAMSITASRQTRSGTGGRPPRAPRLGGNSAGSIGPSTSRSANGRCRNRAAITNRPNRKPTPGGTARYQLSEWGLSRGDFWQGSQSVGTHWHYPTLAVPWRQAFVPTLFAMRGKQPVRVLPPWDALMVNDALSLSIGALVAEDTADYRWNPATHLLADWRERFDYALVLNADMPDGAGPVRPVPGLELVADEGFARLYRIHRLAPEDRGRE